MSSEAVASAPHGALPNLAEVPEEIRDQVWLDTYYQGDSVRQLTVRAVVMGSILGMMMSLSNLYIGLKTGWGLGVAITSCILSYAIWTVFLKFGWAKQPMSILENNCMQSTATSAGVSTGGTMVSAIAAQLMLTGVHMNWKVLMAWTAFLAFLGVSMAIPMKRQLINREQLKFPSGIAAAETLRSLHAAGGEALIKAQALFWSMGIGAVLQWWQSGMGGLVQTMLSPSEKVAPLGALVMQWGPMPKISSMLQSLGLSAESIRFPLTLPMELELHAKLFGKDVSKLGFVFPVDPLMTAAGMIVGMRTSLSMVISGFALFGIVGPWLDDSGVLREMHASGALSSATLSGSAIRKWGLWTGSSMMVAAGLTAALFQWKSMLAGISKLGALFSGKKQVAAHDPIAHIEVPNSWFVIGTGISGLGCIIIMYTEWDIPLHWGIVAVAMAFVLSLVACRATGETDTTPIGAMGKVTQLFYGAMIPNQPIPNLMTAGVTAGAAGAAADLLTDLKSGYLLGANSRQQTIAQSIGIISGTLAIVPAWYLFVPDASALGTAQFPAPAAEVWKSVAELLSRGISTMHPTILKGIIFGGSLGFLLTLTEGLAPKKFRSYLPSATGLGLGMVIPFGNSFSFLLGALITLIWTKLNEASCEQKMVPIASGIVAGCSLMAVFIMILQAAGLLPLG